MDLRNWILAEHDLVAGRLHEQVLAHVPIERHRERVDGGGSTLTFLLWHLARHQDLAVNGVVRERPQVIDAHRAAVGADGLAPGDGLAESEDPSMTAGLDPDAVLAYHAAVSSETGSWLRGLDADDLDRVPESGIALTDAGVAHDEFPWLHRMWDAKPVSFFVMWEVVGHGVTHLGEMVSMRNRMGLSPF